MLHEGRVLQTGRTLELYQSPATERVGQIFSDPQMNLWDAEVTPGAGARLSPEVVFPLSGHLRGLAPGRYRLGVRAHHVRLAPGAPGDVRIPAHVEVEEVSGSESALRCATLRYRRAEIASGDGIEKRRLAGVVRADDRCDQMGRAGHQTR